MTDLAKQRALDFLRQAVGDPTVEFRPGQWEAIEGLVHRRERLIVVQRTGWGKSLVYFLATRLLRDQGRGPTLIVSPLLVLMRDQKEAAARLGLRAEPINSANQGEWPQLKADTLEDRVDALLISPERLANEEFVSDILLPIAHRVGLLVIDEVHCISDWGHDFRPDYQRLAQVLRRLPRGLPLLGTTATANDRVLADVRHHLGEVAVMRGPLTRESLCLQTLRLPDQAARLAWLGERLPSLPGTGIVYVLTQDDAEQVAGWLQRHGIDARPYHADVKAPTGHPQPERYREELEQLLLGNRLKALVATSALGMGFDKPDLGFIVHYQAPGSIVTYYQQIGRAGRALPKAPCILLAGAEDASIHDYFRESAYPTSDQVEQILDALAGNDGLSVPQLEARLNQRRGRIEKALKVLAVADPPPVFKEGSHWKRTALPHYQLDQARIARLSGQRAREWQEVQAYIDHPGCLMEFLAHALDDPTAAPCGRCSRCGGRPLVAETFDHRLGVEAVRYLRRSELALEARRQVPRDALQHYGLSGRMPPAWQAKTGRILARWGDAGWGRFVAEDKHAGRFRSELVDAAAELILERWRPEPLPVWVTSIPSLRHPELVPDLASRLALKLGISYQPAVTKVLETEPQKLQENSYYQCRNLDGAFEVTVDHNLKGQPVLLVDDVVDSGWTLTVVAILLLRAGTGPVYPLALASSSAGSS